MWLGLPLRWPGMTAPPASWNTRIVELTSQTAVWYRSGKPAVSIRWVLIRDPQGAFDPQALPCTDSSADPIQILEWFVLRWQLEVTPYQVRGRLFQEARTHLGMETQRQWSGLAIARTTPALLASSPGPPWPPTPCRNVIPSPSIPSPNVPRPGTTSRRRPSWMPSPWCDGICGWHRRVFHCPQPAPIRRNSPPLFTTEWSIPSLTPLELRKAQLGAGASTGRAASGTPPHPGTSVSVSTGRSSMGHTGSPVTRSNTYVKPCMDTWSAASISRPSTVMAARFGAAARS